MMPLIFTHNSRQILYIFAESLFKIVETANNWSSSELLCWCQLLFRSVVVASSRVTIVLRMSGYKIYTYCVNGKSGYPNATTSLCIYISVGLFHFIFIVKRLTQHLTLVTYILVAIFLQSVYVLFPSEVLLVNGTVVSSNIFRELFRKGIYWFINWLLVIYGHEVSRLVGKRNVMRFKFFRF